MTIEKNTCSSADKAWGNRSRYSSPTLFNIVRILILLSQEILQIFLHFLFKLWTETWTITGSALFLFSRTCSEDAYNERSDSNFHPLLLVVSFNRLQIWHIYSKRVYLQVQAAQGPLWFILQAEIKSCCLWFTSSPSHVLCLQVRFEFVYFYVRYREYQWNLNLLQGQFL